MTDSALGGLMKIALGGLLGWAWVTGRLATLVGEVTGALGGAAAATAAPASSTAGSPSSSGGII
jgi:hypothetical protein